MTWNPAPASAGACCRHSRPESGKPCSSTTGRPCPITSYSVPTPSTATLPIPTPYRLSPAFWHRWQRLAAHTGVAGLCPVGQAGAGTAAHPDGVEVMGAPHAGAGRGAEVLGEEPLDGGQMGGVAHDLAD